jgi:SAM-dependent methyltransferase
LNAKILDKLRSYYQLLSLHPGWIGLFLNPFYFARHGLHRAMVDASSEISGKLLDVGCGSKPYKNIFSVDSYTGLDIESVAARERGIADHFYDGENFPFKSDIFDSVLCNQVLEHVFNPDQFLREIHRVLKPGGKLLLTVPFVWDEHEQPYDYARYSSFGLKALLERNGFNVRQHKKLGADASILFQLTNAYLFKVTKSWPGFAKIIFTATIMAFINVCGLIAGKILPSNPDLFLDHLVLAEKTL